MERTVLLSGPFIGGPSSYQLQSCSVTTMETNGWLRTFCLERNELTKKSGYREIEIITKYFNQPMIYVNQSAKLLADILVFPFLYTIEDSKSHFECCILTAS